jgi:ElaB/YqjD/DUF883 family membrane-anchored ribosome-binding protein
MFRDGNQSRRTPREQCGTLLMAGCCLSGQQESGMTHNRSLTGAADAIESTKNGELGGAVQDAFDKVNDGAQRVFEDARDLVSNASTDAYDFVGDKLRAGEDYARQKPVQAMAVAAVAGMVLGYMFAVRSAPRASSRYSNWR